MKSNLFSTLLLLIPIILFSQAPTSVNRMIYLDSLWEETTKENHKYYRIVKDYYSEKDSYSVSDYYKSGVLQMSGTSTNRDYLKKEGQCVYYYENGKKKSTSNYKENRKINKEYNWHEDGNIKSEIEYIRRTKRTTSLKL